MGIGETFKTGNWKRVALSVYEEYVAPALKDYVENTDNQWDDAAFATVDGLLREFLSGE